MLTIVENALTAETYCWLRQKVQFRPYQPEDAKTALANSLFTTEVRENGRAVGMARIVGDGRIAFFFKDVVVDPDRQGCGIGQMLMHSLLRYVNTAGCDGAYVGLMATPGTEGFYEKYGFIRRPTPELGHGMVQFVPVALPETAAATAGRYPSPAAVSTPAFEAKKEDFP